MGNQTAEVDRGPCKRGLVFLQNAESGHSILRMEDATYCVISYLTGETYETGDTIIGPLHQRGEVTCGRNSLAKGYGTVRVDVELTGVTVAEKAKCYANLRPSRSIRFAVRN